jgi:hypothetical protein
MEQKMKKSWVARLTVMESILVTRHVVGAWRCSSARAAPDMTVRGRLYLGS